jgi:excisionase family DNA binding protein
MNKKWFSVREAALYFGIKTQTLYSLAARGRLPAKSVLRLGRQLRINVAKIEENGDFLHGQS